MNKFKYCEWNYERPKAEGGTFFWVFESGCGEVIEWFPYFKLVHNFCYCPWCGKLIKGVNK